MNQPGKKDTWRDWAAWLFYGLIISACVSYPLRLFFNPDFWNGLNWWQDIVYFLITVVGIAAFVVRPFVKGMNNDS